MRRLRIAITADPDIPVPPFQYGGIERIVHLLVCGLIEKGHDVTLFANERSAVPCPVVGYTAGSSVGSLLRNAIKTTAQVYSRKFDLIHSFGRLGYLAPILSWPIPKIMSYQRAITRRSVVWGTRLSLGSLHFTACGRHMTGSVQDLTNCHVIYNSVSPAQYTFRAEIDPNAPLVFLGRIEYIKGPHLAIEVARRTGRQLVIAGNIPTGDECRSYFETSIQPYIDDRQIRYIGPVDDAMKNEVLGTAAALLMPVLWEEPFGIVMAEALACGTPVIGLNRGAVPEVIEHGTNGFICSGTEELVDAVKRVDEIRRGECRRVMEERFSSEVMVEQYLGLYRTLLNPPAGRKIEIPECAN